MFPGRGMGENPGADQSLRHKKNMFNIRKVDETKVAIVGLGYVGLPLAVEFGTESVAKKNQTVSSINEK